MLAATGLVAFLLLGGCVFKGEGRRGVYTKPTHHTRVYNVQQRAYPHSHNGGLMHSHVGGNARHDHNKSVETDRGNNGKHKGHHKQCDHADCGTTCHFRPRHDDPDTPEETDIHPPNTRHHHDQDTHDTNDDDHGHGKGHDKDKGKGHGKGKGKGHDKD
jgi:hypothetical protein